MNLAPTHLRLNARLTAMAVDVQGIGGASDAPLLKTTLTNALRQGYRTVVLNLAQLRDLDIRCWEGLVAAARSHQRFGGRLFVPSCPNDQSNFLTRRWDKCFLMPRRRLEDVESRPEGLRPWAADRIGSAPACHFRAQGGLR